MSTLDLRPVLRVGCLAYFDSFAGLVPCRVTAIEGVSGSPGSQQTVIFKLTAPRGPYKRGEIHHAMGHRVVPRAAVSKRRYGARITYYIVEVQS